MVLILISVALNVIFGSFQIFYFNSEMEEVIQISEFSYVFIDRIHKDDAPRDLDSCFLIGVNFSHLFNMSR